MNEVCISGANWLQQIYLIPDGAGLPTYVFVVGWLSISGFQYCNYTCKCNGLAYMTSLCGLPDPQVVDPLHIISVSAIYSSPWLIAAIWAYAAAVPVTVCQCTECKLQVPSVKWREFLLSFTFTTASYVSIVHCIGVTVWNCSAFHRYNGIQDYYGIQKNEMTTLMNMFCVARNGSGISKFRFP